MDGRKEAVVPFPDDGSERFLGAGGATLRCECQSDLNVVALSVFPTSYKLKSVAGSSTISA